MRSGDIRDQSRKLSEIAPKFGRFWPSQILGAGIPKLIPALSPHLHFSHYGVLRPEVLKRASD